MLNSFTKVLLKRWPVFIATLLMITVFMGYRASQIQLSYDFARVLPANDSTYMEYANFKQMFGEDGNIMVIGFKDPNLFTLKKFSEWYELGNDIKKIDGIRDIISIGSVYNVRRNDSLHTFDMIPLVTKVPQSQAEVDSIKETYLSLPFYEGLVYNRETGATLMAITFKVKDLNSKRRITIVEEIKEKVDGFARANQVEMHYSGMPYIRTAFMKKVSNEMVLFLGLAVAVTAIILWLFFRSFKTVVFSVIVVAIGVIWSVGFIELFGYKITILSGLIPPLIMVIGVPNCVFLINKYHGEYKLHGDKLLAITRTVENTSISLLLANITTAIGFGVLYYTNSLLLVEFGVVAALSVMTTYFITLIMIPVVLHLMPAPKERYTKHLSGKRITWVLTFIDRIVHARRPLIYTVTTVLTLISFYGMSKIDIVGYVVDDLPKKDPIYNDLRFFEKNFHGVLPLEVTIGTKEKNGLFADNAEVVYKMNALQRVIKKYPEFSRPISLAEGLKFSYQSYRGGDDKYYVLPNILELKKLSAYMSALNGKEGQLKSFVDSNQQYTRMSYQVADIGSKKMKVLMSELRPKVDSIFDPAKYDVRLTGHSLMFLKNNDYLLDNLIESLIIEIILITLLGLALFRSFRIILLSKIPCLIPLVITAGIMGFLDIPFKPSTILIFSVAFGISSDGSIYLLTKYRQELTKYKRSAADAISVAIKETGLSMIYTSVILFCGFAIFSASDFGGTMALGILVSLTLLVSLCTNVVLLPAILLSISERKPKKKRAK
jgi:predicted RND superfamily exporter protein